MLLFTVIKRGGNAVKVYGLLPTVTDIGVKSMNKNKKCGLSYF